MSETTNLCKNAILSEKHAYYILSTALTNMLTILTQQSIKNIAFIITVPNILRKLCRVALLSAIK